ncbi:NmrA/HSCARG family protein [Paraburkholderia acidiphila]|uniref:NAD(P)H-binding protein n=1 Tax=Paraburkholderia acidiphila TaxID=2571747 RepID=A0A7Z2G997_9BURK|nr:NmrA/HSCARG family protein [Paraburkholderia acidiphila]QGZ57543.1 NAD(P)H-binding protein [Paraburkholderia acidiphila]
MSNTQKLIAVVGATGQQGGAVVRALQSSGQFKVRALTRNPAAHPTLGDEVALADFNRPETLEAAFSGVHGLFLVTNSWEAGADEYRQALVAINAAKAAGVQHVIWSTLPNVETISLGRFNVPHFTSKAKVERLVSEAGFRHHTFVIAPFYYQNLTGAMAPQTQADGTAAWALPLDSERRVIHMGDIAELGQIVAGAFAQPDRVGHGEHLPLVGDFLSFNEIVDTLNRQGNAVSFKQVPREVFSGWFPGAEDIAAMLAYFEAYTYLGADSYDAIALANEVAGRQPTKFAAWAKANFAMPAPLREPT